MGPGGAGDVGAFASLDKDGPTATAGDGVCDGTGDNCDGTCDGTGPYGQGNGNGYGNGNGACDGTGSGNGPYGPGDGTCDGSGPGDGTCDGTAVGPDPDDLSTLLVEALQEDSTTHHAAGSEDDDFHPGSLAADGNSSSAISLHCQVEVICIHRRLWESGSWR